MTQDDPKDLPLDLHLGSATAAPSARRFGRRWLLLLLAPLLLFTGAVLGMYFQPPGLRVFYGVTGLQPGAGSSAPIALPPTIDLPPRMAETLLPSDVIGLSRLMPRGDMAIVAAPYGAGDARLAEILVAEGARVEKGTILARLDNGGALETAVLTAEAALAVREATLAQTRAAVQSSRDEAQATLAQSRAAADVAATQQRRIEELFRRGVATQTTLDSARSAAEEAHQAVARAEATLARFATLALEDQPDIRVADRNLAAARADLARARRDLDRAQVVAPITGTVLDVLATPGQRPPAEGIMVMGDTDHMMAEVEVWQDRIVAVQVGQPVEMVAAALGETLRGRVESIGLTVGRQGLISDDAAANKDARVIRVLVALDPASSAIAQRYTNLEVIARIDTTAQQRAKP